MDEPVSTVDELEAQLAAVTAPEAAMSVEPPAVDPAIVALRAKMNGLDNINDIDTFVDNLATLQQERDAFEARIREQEAQYSALMLAQSQKPTEPEPAAPTQAQVQAEIRRLESIRLDPKLTAFLGGQYAEVDERGFYKPKVQVPQVWEACNIQNQALQRQAEISRFIVDDFYGAVDEGLKFSPAYKSLQAELAALRGDVDKRLAPIQEVTQQQAIQEFNWNNRDVLFQQDPTNAEQLVPSPAGELYGSLLASRKFTPEEALALVKPMAARLVPPTPVAATPPPAPVKPRRFIEPIVKRGAAAKAGKPVERRGATAFDDNTPWKMDYDDVARIAREQAEM